MARFCDEGFGDFSSKAASPQRRKSSGIWEGGVGRSENNRFCFRPRFPFSVSHISGREGEKGKRIYMGLHEQQGKEKKPAPSSSATSRFFLRQSFFLYCIHLGEDLFPPSSSFFLLFLNTHEGKARLGWSEKRKWSGKIRRPELA